MHDDKEQRKNPRYHSVCRAHIDNALKSDAVLKNISVTGCCLECSVDSDGFKQNQIYKINIEPEKAAHTEKFELEVECKWIHKKVDTCEVGLQIISFPTGKGFLSYVNYLAFNSTIV